MPFAHVGLQMSLHTKVVSHVQVADDLVLPYTC